MGPKSSNSKKTKDKAIKSDKVKDNKFKKSSTNDPDVLVNLPAGLKYKVPGKLLKKPGKYTLQARLRSRAEPIYFMKFVGSTQEMEQRINDWMLDFHSYAVSFEID